MADSQDTDSRDTGSQDTTGKFSCESCDKTFTVKSNLTRHLKTHSTPSIPCDRCDKTFTLKQHLKNHLKQHLYPIIRKYNATEARLKQTSQADKVKADNNKTFDKVWTDVDSAEERARQLGGDELWRACLVLTWGQYAGQSFKWLLENDVGWTAWLLAQFSLHGETNTVMKWQKQQLASFVEEFQLVQKEVEKKIKVLTNKRPSQPATQSSQPGTQSSQPATQSSQPATQSSQPSAEQNDFPDSNYITDAELLSAAENALVLSDVPVKTTITTIGKLVTSSEEKTPELPSTSATDPSSLVLEGWHKSWEEPQGTHGIVNPNIRWLKDSLEFGLFHPSKPFKNYRGEVIDRKILKDRMEFHPPPLPTSMMGSVPNMTAFFTTRVFFWRPVGVMKANITCPNSNCPSPDAYLTRKGYGSRARQVCSLTSYYTLLTERLQCIPCYNLRRSSQSALHDSDSEEDDTGQQYSFLAYSPRILMRLSPAVQNLFPAVVCGKRTIDKNIVTLLDDKINSLSMSKVQRIVQQGHDKWYRERRHLYQTFLYEAHKPKGSNTGILQYVRPAGKYTPPIPKPPLPSARVLRRAHLLLEMEKMPDYRASILSVTGEILSIDGTRQVLKKIKGDGQGTMQYVTSVLNEWGQFLTTVVVASESEGSYRRFAQGLISRFNRANCPAPKILYADNNCCRDGSSSFLEILFKDWVDEGMVVRLDIRHWLHRWDKVIIKQTHSKYGAFMSAMAGAILAYNRYDMMQLVQSIRSGNEEMYLAYSDEQMIHFVKPWQLKSYVRRVTRGIEETANTVESILAEFKGPAGLDIDGIHLFKSDEAVDDHWRHQASKHLSCMQDPPGIQLYVATKQVKINGVLLNKYRCRRGSNSLEGLHAHLNSAIPSQCGIIPFQVYLIAFAVQWNSRMESLRVAGGKGLVDSCTDPRLIQQLNQQSEFLFGKENIYEPNFVAPMPYPDRYDHEDQEELLGVEYAQCQSTRFTSREYYAERVEEEQANEDEGNEGDAGEEDEGVSMEEGEEDTSDPVDAVNSDYAVLTQTEAITEAESPALEDVLAPSHLHLPGFEEVEALALALLELAADGDQHFVSQPARQRILYCFGKIKDHDRSVRKFVKKYESRWGYTLFGRCLGPDSPGNSAAQKTKFARRYAPAMQITENSRLLYLLVKMIKNRPPASDVQSPAKQVTKIKSVYKRIVDRVDDDSTLSALELPLPNLNAKSISTFLTRQDQKRNLKATQVPKSKPRQSVLSDAPLPEVIKLPHALIPTHAQVQYPVKPHMSGKRQLEKRRLDFDDPNIGKKKPAATTTTAFIRPRPCVPTDQAPILMVTPSQPEGPSVSFEKIPFMLSPPPKPLPAIRCIPSKAGRPCAACHIPQCGGLRKRYTISVDGKRRIFTFCPTSRRSTTTGYDDKEYDDYEHFKMVVNESVSTNM